MTARGTQGPGSGAHQRLIERITRHYSGDERVREIQAYYDLGPSRRALLDRQEADF